jgi:hypothetical protein
MLINRRFDLSLLLAVLILLSYTVSKKSKSLMKTMRNANNKYYHLSFRHSGKCLDINGGHKENGAPAIQWDCHGGDNQKFRMVWNDDDTVTLYAKHSGKVLDVTGHANVNGAKIIQWDYHGGNNQKWSLQHTDSGHFLVRAKNSGKCLDVPNGNKNSGNHIQQWDW